MFSFLTKIFGTSNDRIIKKLQQEIHKINALEASMQNLTDSELQRKTAYLKQKLQHGHSIDEITYEAFAVVREVANRVIKQRHYDIQLVGGLILHRGMVNEMRTGEGKTLVATLPAYLNALIGQGVHIVTVNDYLAQRDAEWMGKIFRFLGMSVSCIIGNMDDEQRKIAYQCDIIYATNNELGFDFLRDNMKFTQASKTQRPFYYAIIDEVDSILIDEARTPLVISGPVDHNMDLYVKINPLIRNLAKENFDLEEKTKSIMLNDIGINNIESILIKHELIAPNSSLYDFDNLNLVHYINQSLKAHHLFTKDVDYLIQDNKIMIIDEFTGRVMEGRRYSDGLHQSLEAKENLPIQNENQTLASITFQNYFRMYPKLSGMTGTAMTEAGELKDIYNLEVVSVPTHKPITRIDYDDEIYGSNNEKYNAIIKQIQKCYEKGQPVLVGTISIEKSEEISAALTKSKIKHNVLNAKMHQQEAYVIAQAGRYKAVTIATNMAGRGTDIKLGGNVEMMIENFITQKDKNLSQSKINNKIKDIKLQVDQEKIQVLNAGGLFVIGTERHESRRIDNQLRGRSGRQGDPGSTKFFLSLEDDLMRIFASERIAGILRTLGLKDGEAIHHPMISKSLEKAQQKVESNNYEIRKNLLKFDDVMNEQRKIVYEQRNDIMTSDDVGAFFDSMSQQLSDDVVQQSIPANSLREEWKLSQLISEINRFFAIKSSVEEIEKIEGAENEISIFLHKKILALFNQKKSEYTEDLMMSASKYILLSTLDQLWKEHLHHLDHLRQGISLRAYGQKDPLIEYKREAFKLFEQMIDKLKELFVQRICFLHIDKEHVDERNLMLANKAMQEMRTSRIDPAFEKYNAGSAISTIAKPFKAFVDPKDRDMNDPESWGKLSRNESCPCKSGKKYKHCHGAVS